MYACMMAATAAAAAAVKKSTQLKDIKCVMFKKPLYKKERRLQVVT